MFMAMDRNKLVGRGGDMPWQISSDLQYFKRMTMSKPLVMGRVTFESLGGVLPGRPHVVVTRDENWQYSGVEVVNTIEQGIAAARRHEGDELMIIGGADICAQVMPFTERLYLTVIDHAFEGDRWLDSFDWGDWKEISRDEQDETSDGGYRFTWYVLESAVDSDSSNTAVS